MQIDCTGRPYLCIVIQRNRGMVPRYWLITFITWEQFSYYCFLLISSRVLVKLWSIVLIHIAKIVRSIARIQWWTKIVHCIMQECISIQYPCTANTYYNNKNQRNRGTVPRWWLTILKLWEVYFCFCSLHGCWRVLAKPSPTPTRKSLVPAGIDSAMSRRHGFMTMTTEDKVSTKY